MSRVPLPDADEIVAEAPHLFETLSVDDLNAARAMGNAPHALAGLLGYMDGLYSSLPIELRELAILTVARYYDSAYEWHQHVGVAREAGIDLETIQAIGGRQWDQLPTDRRAVADAVRAQCDGRFSEDHYDTLAEQYETDEIVAMSMLVGHYTGVAQFIDAMALPVEDAFVGWVPDDEQ